MKITDEINLESISEQQRSVVETFEGPLLIAAGPGTGKTKTYINRALYMINEGGVAAKEILLISLNPKKDRKHPFVYTFHSLCLKILRNYSFKLSIPKNFKVYDSVDQLNILQKFIKDAKKKSLNDILSRISYLKKHLILPTNAPLELQEAYRQYQAYLKEENALDFDDLILKTVQLLKKHPEVFKALEWKYISVDDFQEVTKAQYELLKLLTKGNQNLCVFGDADQAINSTNGENVQNFINFGNDFPEVKFIQFENNYRSTPEIIKASESIIKKNKDKMNRKISALKKIGKPIFICETEDEKAEADYIIKNIKMYTYSNSDYKYSDFAVLFRTNLHSKLIKDLFSKKYIPFQTINSNYFCERGEIKDVISYLRVIYDPDDKAALLRIINKPSRGITETLIEKLELYSRVEGISFYQTCQEIDTLQVNDESKNTVGEFVKLIESFRYKATEFKISELIKYIYEEIKFYELYKDKTRQDNLSKLVKCSLEYDNYPPYECLEAFLNEVVLLKDVDFNDDEVDSVTLSTLHASKYQEFKVVFIIGVEEKIIPYINFNEVEERRLFYVGLSRAEDELHLIHAKERNLFDEKINSAPSRFLKDISEEIKREKSHERKKRTIKKTKVQDSQLALF